MGDPVVGQPASAARARALLLAAACALGFPACHPQPRTATGPARSGDEIVITAEQIARYRVRTAWEAVKRGAPQLNYTQNSAGDPQQVRRRGRASLYLSDTPLLVLDGVQMSDITALVQIPSEQVRVIRVLTGLAATTEYGTRAGGGAILVETKDGSSQDSTPKGRS